MKIPFISKETLNELYWNQQLSFLEIEKRLGCKKGRVAFWFKKYQIPVRTPTDRLKQIKRTDTWKEKISNSLRGHAVTVETRSKLSVSHTGKQLSDTHLENVKIAIERRKGWNAREKHPQWKGGRSLIRDALRQTAQYKNWRNSIFERDNFTCQICKHRGGALEAHHIIPWKEIIKQENLHTYQEYVDCLALWELRNGITLCYACHQLTKHREQSIKHFLYDQIKTNYS